MRFPVLGFLGHGRGWSWRRNYFYMKEATPAGHIGIPQYRSEKSNPRNLDAAVEAKDSGMVFRMQSRLRELTQHCHLNGTSLISSWIRRRIAPLQSRASLMWDYTGTNLSAPEVARMVSGITTCSFGSLDDPMTPFSSAKPPPDVSF